MAVVNSSTITIKNAEAEAFNLGSITQSPRTAMASDLDAACNNLLFESQGVVPDMVLAAVKFVFIDFFTQAHQSGLYNRQIKLWDALSKISVVEVKQLSKGLFQKIMLPVFEINFKTMTGQTPAVGLIIEPCSIDAQLNLYKEFLGRVAKNQARFGDQIKGVFVFCDSPFPPSILTQVEKAVGASDPVAKFDSILPSPYHCHINLVVKVHARGAREHDHSVDSESVESKSESTEFASATGHSQIASAGHFYLLHPQLRRQKRPADSSLTNKAQIIYKY